MVESTFFICHADDDADSVRTRVRQAAIIRAREDGGLQSDENNWSLAYPVEIVEWVCDIMEGTEDKFTPGEILETEEKYPGLWNNISILRWQRRLIKDQEGGE